MHCVGIGKLCALSIYSTSDPGGLLHHQVFATQIDVDLRSRALVKRKICNDTTKNSKPKEGIELYYIYKLQ